MESKIGWVDLSPLQRDRVKKFMDLMGMGGVQDELGVGIIRDAMSNRIFPGFSTLYTRAKYFFITPYLLLDRDSNKQDKKQSGIDYFKKAEIGANKIIIDFYESHPDRMDESYFGKYSYKIISTAYTSGSRARIYQDINSSIIQPGKTYTLQLIEDSYFCIVI